MNTTKTTTRKRAPTDVPEGHRWCCICDQVKPVEEFHKDRSRRDGLRNRCRACQAAYDKAWREAIAERHRRNGVSNHDVKFCPGCQLLLHATEFNSNRHQPDGRQKHCRECERARWATTSGRAKKLVYKALYRDRQRGFTSAIKIPWQEVAALIEAGTCEATGVSFDLSQPPEGQHYNPRSPSIDRIDHEKPYQPDGEPRNWRVVITAYNIARHELTDGEHERLIINPMVLRKGANPFPLLTPQGRALDDIARGVIKRAFSALLIPLPQAD